MVIVQSNPVEMGVQIFSDAVGRHRVIGAGAWSDTLRFRAELARSLRLRRTHIQAWTLGQHADHLVPCRSQIRAWGVTGDAVMTLQEQLREQAELQSFPERLREQRAALLEYLQHTVRPAGKKCLGWHVFASSLLLVVLDLSWCWLQFRVSLQPFLKRAFRRSEGFETVVFRGPKQLSRRFRNSRFHILSSDG